MSNFSHIENNTGWLFVPTKKSVGKYRIAGIFWKVL
jgi:hypothetical protein